METILSFLDRDALYITSAELDGRQRAELVAVEHEPPLVAPMAY